MFVKPNIMAIILFLASWGNISTICNFRVETPTYRKKKKKIVSCHMSIEVSCGFCKHYSELYSYTFSYSLYKTVMLFTIFGQKKVLCTWFCRCKHRVGLNNDFIISHSKHLNKLINKNIQFSLAFNLYRHSPLIPPIYHSRVLLDPDFLV